MNTNVSASKLSVDEINLLKEDLRSMAGLDEDFTCCGDEIVREFYVGPVSILPGWGTACGYSDNVVFTAENMIDSLLIGKECAVLFSIGDDDDPHQRPTILALAVQADNEREHELVGRFVEKLAEKNGGSLRADTCALGHWVCFESE